jgi:hypothetical protein
MYITLGLTLNIWSKEDYESYNVPSKEAEAMFRQKFITTVNDMSTDLRHDVMTYTDECTLTYSNETTVNLLNLKLQDSVKKSLLQYWTRNRLCIKRAFMDRQIISFFNLNDESSNPYAKQYKYFQIAAKHRLISIETDLDASTYNDFLSLYTPPLLYTVLAHNWHIL